MLVKGIGGSILDTRRLSRRTSQLHRGRGLGAERNCGAMVVAEAAFGLEPIAGARRKNGSAGCFLVCDIGHHARCLTKSTLCQSPAQESVDRRVELMRQKR